MAASSTAARRAILPLLLILAVYLMVGALYAWFTPAWQAPDEPAHFNYVRQIATSGSPPVLQAGDYDQTYLDILKAEKFPPDLPIDSVRYEGHQPPLYYYLAAPIWLIASGNVVVLRMFGVLLGAGVISLVWASARRLFPARPGLAAIAAGFVAFLPMHIAMFASINNDALSELLIAVGVYQLIGHVSAQRVSARDWALTGIVIGLALLTKFQAYILLPLAGGAWLWQVRRVSDRPSAWRTGLAWLAPALLLALPWWLRNMQIYGEGDPFGLQRHDAIVTGQARTAEWIAAFGWSGYLDRLTEFTFKSFWGVFGWLGVFLDSRVYVLLGVLSLLALVGLAWQIRDWRRNRALTQDQRRGLLLLLANLLLVILAYAWYNLTFVQHQGRYLFPAIVALSVGFGLGFDGVLTPGGSRWGAGVALALAVAACIFGALQGDIPSWTLLILLVAAGLLFARSRLTRPATAVWQTATLALLVLVDLYALFGAIIPQLR